MSGPLLEPCARPAGPGTGPALAPALLPCGSRQEPAFISLPASTCVFKRTGADASMAAEKGGVFAQEGVQRPSSAAVGGVSSARPPLRMLQENQLSTCGAIHVYGRWMRRTAHSASASCGTSRSTGSLRLGRSRSSSTCASCAALARHCAHRPSFSQHLQPVRHSSMMAPHIRSMMLDTISVPS